MPLLGFYRDTHPLGKCGYFYTTKRILDKFVWLNMDVKILQRLHKKTERNNKLENINIIWRRWWDKKPWERNYCKSIKDKNKMITEKGRTAGSNRRAQGWWERNRGILIDCWVTVVFSPMGKEMLCRVWVFEKSWKFWVWQLIWDLKAESRETDQKLDKRSFLRLFGKVDGDLGKKCWGWWVWE